MKKIAIVYWSGTGNTEAMAAAVSDGVKEAGGEVTLLGPTDFSAAMMDTYDAVAFGCPAMGAEQLEECDYEPMFMACEPKLSGKRIALFGSYGWGDGEWMRLWEKRCVSKGAVLVSPPVICNEAPGDDDVKSCRALGAALL